MLSRDAILDAGLELLDERGPAALSMRAIGQRLGVTATALYYHYEGQEDLLEAIVDRVCDRIVRAVPDGPAWDDRLQLLMSALVDEASAHPDVFAWVVTEYARRRAVREIHELMLEILDVGGFDPEMALQVKGALLRLSVGHLILRTAAAGPAWSQLPEGEFPRHWQAGSALDTFDPEAHFRIAVDMILEGFGALRRNSRAS